MTYEPKAWRIVQEVILRDYGDHQDCDNTCTHASMEESEAAMTANNVVLALLDHYRLEPR